MSEFLDFKRFLPKALNKYNMSRQARAATVCKRFRELAPGMMGDEAASHAVPKFFKHGRLTIAVPSSLWAQHVYVHRHELITRINLELGEGTVKEIRTVVE